MCNILVVLCRVACSNYTSLIRSMLDSSYIAYVGIVKTPALITGRLCLTQEKS